MEEVIQVFGELSIGAAISVIVAIACLIKPAIKGYKWLRDMIISRHMARQEMDNTLQKILAQEAQYPVWRQQSLDIQRELTQSIEGLRTAQAALSEKIDQIELARQQQKRNELRERLLTAYRYYTSAESNPMQAWSEMEAQSFWYVYRDYEEYGGNGHMHDTVKPAMRELEVIPMHEAEQVAALMQSRR